MQRLFSSFANGWPGHGLLLLRMLTGFALIHYGIVDLREAHQFASIAPQIIAAGAGILLLVGLWTPVTGALVAIAEVWIAFSRAGDPWIPIMSGHPWRHSGNGRTGCLVHRCPALW